MKRTLLIFLAVVVPVCANAQGLDASLAGIVIDDTGAPLQGAIVTATDVARGSDRTTATDTSGRYRLLNLIPGRYDVTVDLAGFTHSTRHGVPLHVGSTLTIDWPLRVAVAEDVTVTADRPMLETATNTLTRIVQSAEIDTVPVIDRNFNSLAALAPGVTNTGVYGGVDISGSRDYQNAYLVDGISVERQRLGDQQIAFAQDWIREFQVMTSQFTAEFGRASGGVINVITRSGSNRLDGRVYGFFRSGAWDATPAFVTTKPPFDEQRLGGMIGGPLVHDKAFYFGGIERLRTQSSNIVRSTFEAANGAVPSESRRTLPMLKVDMAPRSAVALRFGYNGQREHATGFGVGGTSTEEHGRTLDIHADDLLAAATWMMSPARVHEIRAAWNTSTPEGGCTFAARYPPGTWFERNYPGAQFGCPVNFGTIAEHQWQFIDNLSWSIGAHDAKAGVQWFRTRSSGDFRNVRDGRYSFERDVPFALSDPASYPFSFVIIDGPTTWNVAGEAVGLFAQDNWRVARRLTLNGGVRYHLDLSLRALNPLVRLDRGMHTFETDANNVAPRIGMSWLPFDDDGRTVVRAGTGVYYDQHHDNVTTTLLLNNVLVNRVININTNNALLNPFGSDIAAGKRFLADALARNGVPDLSALPAVLGATNDVDPHFQIPWTMQTSVGIARHVRDSVNASVDVVVARGHDLYVLRDVNLDPVTFRRINPNYSTVQTFGNGGWDRYTALQAQVSIVPSTGRLLKLAYTLGSSRSNTTSTLSAGPATNPFDYSEDEGPADNDVRHVFAANGAVMMPLGVEASGALVYRSALPYSATTNAPRPDGRPFGFRPEPRNARRGDDMVSLDVRAAKVVRVSSGVSAQVFAEVFNLTNTNAYSDYIGTITSAAFGQPTRAAAKRRVQLGFRVAF